MKNMLCPLRDVDHICSWPIDQNLSHELLTRKGSELGGQQQILDIGAGGGAVAYGHFILEDDIRDFATEMLIKELFIIEGGGEEQKKEKR